MIGSMKPAVSIIIPVYNSEQYLRECIDSILCQTFDNFECILIDDCSNDNSLSICYEYEKKDKRIKVIKNENNIGSSLIRKKGLTIANGNYIQFIDSDDWIDKNMINKLYNKAISENLDIVFCDCYYYKEGIEKLIIQRIQHLDKINLIKYLLSMKMKSYLVNKLIKRELYLHADFPRYNRSEDYYITIQNIYNSNDIGYINEPLYYYRYNEKSLSNNNMHIGRIEENKNWLSIINFLKKEYTDLSIFEPELSGRINDLKDIYFFDKKLRNMKDLFLLYPESHYFRKRMAKSFLRRMIPKTIKYHLKYLIKKAK